MSSGMTCETCEHLGRSILESGADGGAVCELTENRCFIGDIKRQPDWCPIRSETAAIDRADKQGDNVANTVEFEDVTLEASTDKAGLFVIDGEDVWIPWSQVQDGSVDKDGETGTLIITEWIAEQKNLI